MKTFQLLKRDQPVGLRYLADDVVELAMDLRWTWSHAGDAVWKKLDAETWEQTKNPYAILQNITQERLQTLDQDSDFKAQVQQLLAAHQDYCQQPGWYGETHGNSVLQRIAYFSLEFGLGEALPLYAGGLGILAGDYLKAASDLGVPVVAVGLLYQQGYFRQILGADGQQQEIYSYNDPTSVPVRQVLGQDGAWLHVHCDFPGRKVRFRVWQAQVGRTTLYLLDSNDPLNSPVDQGITSKLYGGGQELRLIQEIVLGVCGWRLLEALGLQVEVCHLNEGHAAFVTLERARSFMEKNQCDFWNALTATRPGNIFTTHTPVAAGFDTFEKVLLEKYLHCYADLIHISTEQLLSLGRINSHQADEAFNMAYLAMRTCGLCNGVSQLHGEVSRGIFQQLYPRWPRREVPVMHITNGVHVPTWDSPWADELWTKAAGKNRWLGNLEPLTQAIKNLSDEALWTFCGREREDLVMYARKRLARQVGQRGADSQTVALAAEVLDPNILTLGFARRFASYKRPNLLLHEPERLVRLLTRGDRPVQIIVAGKAHPKDVEGKQLLQAWAQFVQRPEVRVRAVFLEDYDISLAQEMVQGVDVWINTPRRPWEASGTSGMKVLVNGGLNLSELDGWWAEAYAEDLGWALGDGAEHAEAEWDSVEAEQLYHLLEQEIIPMFYDRDAAGIPRAWVERMRNSMARLTPQFSTNRMVRDYVEKMYLPAAAAFQKRTLQGGEVAQQLCQWDEQLRHHWHEVHWGNLVVHQQQGGWVFEVQVYLGEVSPESVQAQLYAVPLEVASLDIGQDIRNGDVAAEDINQRDLTSGKVSQPGLAIPAYNIMQRHKAIPGSVNGYLYQCALKTSRPFTDFTPRMVAYHPQAKIPTENNLILWWAGTVEYAIE